MRIDVPLFDVYGPGTGHSAIVYVWHGLHDLRGQTGLRCRDGNHLSLIKESSDRADHGCRAGPKHLDQPAFAVGLHHLRHRDLPLGHLHPWPGAAHLHDGPPGHSRQDDPWGQWRCDKFLRPVLTSQQDENVHRSDLRYLVIGTKEPETLLATVLFRNLNQNRVTNPRLQWSWFNFKLNLLCPKCGGIISSHLVKPQPKRNDQFSYFFIWTKKLGEWILKKWVETEKDKKKCIGKYKPFASKVWVHNLIPFWWNHSPQARPAHSWGHTRGWQVWTQQRSMDPRDTGGRTGGPRQRGQLPDWVPSRSSWVGCTGRRTCHGGPSQNLSQPI